MSQSSGKKASEEERTSFTFDCSAVLLSWNICPVFPQRGAADFFPSHYLSSSSYLAAFTILFLLLLSLTLSALTQPFSLRLTAPEVNWKTGGRACVTTLTSANPEVARTISIPQALYPQASVCASAFNPTWKSIHPVSTSPSSWHDVCLGGQRAERLG